jgi:hypothetical protein
MRTRGLPPPRGAVGVRVEAKVLRCTVGWDDAVTGRVQVVLSCIS